MLHSYKVVVLAFEFRLLLIITSMLFLPKIHNLSLIMKKTQTDRHCPKYLSGTLQCFFCSSGRVILSISIQGHGLFLPLSQTCPELH
jgi:hypothetical protein